MKKEAVRVLKPRKGKKMENKVNKVFPKKEIDGVKKVIGKSLSPPKPRGPKPKVLSIQNINVGKIFEGLSTNHSQSGDGMKKLTHPLNVTKNNLKNAATIEDKMAAAPVTIDRENSGARGPKNKRPKSQALLDEANVVTKKAKIQPKTETALIEKPKISHDKKKVTPNTVKETTKVKPEISKKKSKIASKSEAKKLQAKVNLPVVPTNVESKIAVEKKEVVPTSQKEAGKMKSAFSKDKRKVTPKIDKESMEVESTITKESGNVETKKSYQNEIKNSGDLKLTKQHVLSSIKAIKKLTQKKLNTATSLLPTENHPILLQVTAVRVARTPRRQIRPTLPHSMVSSMDDVAIFVPDLVRGRKRDFEKTVEHWEEIFREKGVECIKQIIPMNQLKTEYGQFEMRNKLAMSFDYFLADGRIVGHVSHLLGKSFFKRRSPPTPVKLYSNDLKKELDKALHKSCMEIHSYGDSHTIQVGTVSMKSPKLAENIWATCESLAAQYPGGWSNVRAIRIKSQISESIPIYMTFVNKNKVRVPVVKPKRPRAYETVEGELTTVGGGPATVTVTPEGRVIVKREKREIKKETDDEVKVKTEEVVNTDDEDDAEAESEDEDDDDDDDDDDEDEDEDDNDENKDNDESDADE